MILLSVFDCEIILKSLVINTITGQRKMKKLLLIIIYIVAVFFAVDSCYIALVPKDKWLSVIEALLAGFFIFSVIVLSDKEKTKNN